MLTQPSQATTLDFAFTDVWFENATTEDWNGTFDTTTEVPTTTVLKPPDTPPVTGTRYASGICMTVIMIVAVCGNSLVLTAMYRTPALRRVNTLMYVSLCVTDLSRTVFCMPFFTFALYTNKWSVPDAACPLYHIAYITLRFVSVLNLVVISAERAYIIHRPLSYQRVVTSRRMKLCIVAIWTASFLYGSLNSLWFVLAEEEEPSTEPEVNKDNEKQVNIPCRFEPALGFAIFDFLLTFVLPLVVIFVAYIRIFLTVNAQMQRIRPDLFRSNKACAKLETHNRDADDSREPTFFGRSRANSDASRSQVDVEMNDNTQQARDDDVTLQRETNIDEKHTHSVHTTPETNLRRRNSSVTSSQSKQMTACASPVPDAETHNSCDENVTIEEGVNTTNNNNTGKPSPVSIRVTSHDSSDVTPHARRYTQHRTPRASPEAASRRHKLRRDSHKCGAFHELEHAKLSSDVTAGGACDCESNNEVELLNVGRIIHMQHELQAREKSHDDEGGKPPEHTEADSSSAASLQTNSRNDSSASLSSVHSKHSAASGSIPTSHNSSKCSQEKLNKRSSCLHSWHLLRRNKATKLTVAVAGTFILCWAPFEVTFLVGRACSTCIGDIMWFIVNTLAFLSSAINPFVYSLYSNEFRKAVRKILPCRRKDSL